MTMASERTIAGGRPAPLPARAMGAVCAALLLAACGPAGDVLDEVVVRDSADVLVVENPPDAEARAPRWSVDPEPLLEIGSVEGEGPDQFSRIAGGRSPGVARLTDGTIAVADMQAREIRFFDPEGNHLRTAGGQGQGPGELDFPEGLFVLPGDTVATWDLNLRRFTLLDRTGRYATTLTPPAGAPVSGLVGFVGTREVIAEGSTGGAARPGDPEEVRTVRSHFLRVDLARDAAVDTVVTAGEGLLLRWADGAGGMGGFTSVPYSVGATAVAEPGRLVVTGGERPELQVYDGGGRLRRVIRIAGGPEPLPASRFAEEVDRRVQAATTDDARRELRRRHGLMPPPGNVPSWIRILLDPEGPIWVERFHPRWEDRFYGGRPVAASHWTIFDAAGEVTATVELPAGFMPHRVAGTWVLGVHRDELGVEFVRLLALRDG